MKRLIDFLFPPKLGRVEYYQESCVAGGSYSPHEEGEILWKAYDVKRTGIEKHFAEQEDANGREA